jgi:hypothetical protein
VHVDAGRFESSVRLFDVGTERGDRETLWFAEGAGLVKSAGDGSRVRLAATSLRRR